MVKSCRKYWTKEIADSVIQLRMSVLLIRRWMFGQVLIVRILLKCWQDFGIEQEKVEGFTSTLIRRIF